MHGFQEIPRDGGAQAATEEYNLATQVALFSNPQVSVGDFITSSVVLVTSLLSSSDVL